MSNDDHCIHSFDKSGRKKPAVGSQGSGDVQFSFLITGITIYISMQKQIGCFITIVIYTAIKVGVPNLETDL